MVDGTIDFTNAPATGTLVLTVDNGTSTYDTTLNLPFISPESFSISNIPSDGASMTITVVFSANGSCTSSINATAPSSCACDAEIGTFNSTMTGQSQNNYVLCFGDELSLNSNNDGVPPNEMFNPPSVYNPGISWLMYSCQPSIGLVANASTTLTDDPCFLGLLGNGNQVISNDMSLINLFPPGTFTDNIIYFLPITMYDTVGGIFSYVNGGVLPCYETGVTYPVQFLPEVTFETTENCANNSVMVSNIIGGLPSINGSNYSYGNLFPSSANFVNSGVGVGDSIIISGLSLGDSLGFELTDNNGCVTIVSLPYFNGKVVADFNLPNQMCEDMGIVSMAALNGGGVFSANCGSCMTSSGVFDPSVSGTGIVDVTYEISSTCGDTIMNSIEVMSREDASFYIDDFCSNSPVPASILGDGGGTFTLLTPPNNEYIDVTSGELFNTQPGTTYDVVYTSGGFCPNQDTVSVTVLGSNVCPVIFNNAFTPNSDGVNDTWDIPDYVINKSNKVVLYNRWGDVLREFVDYDNDQVIWDGKDKNGDIVSAGTYFYLVEVPSTNYSNSGWIQLIK